jgi:hypothetical protein
MAVPFVSLAIKVSLSGLKKYGEAVSQMAKGGGTSPIVQECLEKWEARWRAYIQARWVKYSKGGGDWPPLKKGYRPGGSILRDTSTMFNAMSPFMDAPGKFSKQSGFSVTVGFGGPEPHPRAKNLTISQLAEIHQRGLGNVPVREMVVPPDEKTQLGMKKDAEVALKKLKEQNEQ